MSENIEKESAGIELAKRDYIPDLSVGITKETGKMSQDDIMIMFSVNLPVWRNRLKSNLESATDVYHSATAAHNNKENELVSQLSLSHYKMLDAHRQLILYKDTLIPSAIQTLNSIQSQYESGKIDFLSLVDAQRTLLNFQLNYYRQKVNYHLRFAYIKYLIGTTE